MSTPSGKPPAADASRAERTTETVERAVVGALRFLDQAAQLDPLSDPDEFTEKLERLCAIVRAVDPEPETPSDVAAEQRALYGLVEQSTREALAAGTRGPVLIDRFLEDAFEVDVDALADGEGCVIAGIMQHIEEAGVHSGDSSCVLPPYNIAAEHIEEIRVATRKLAGALGVVGLMNVQYAIAEGELFVLEVNPRASRTVPFLAKATGVPLVKIATRLMLGESLADVTHVVVLSEMGRTPQYNATNGRDHWPYTSALIIGPNVTGNRTIGGFNDLYGGIGVDLASGELDQNAPGIDAKALGSTLLALGDVDPAAYITKPEVIQGVLA